MVKNNNMADRRSRRRWIILGVICITSLTFTVTFQSIPPILNLIMAELKLSHAEGGLLMSIYALPGIFVPIPAGMLADRYSQKKIGIISLVLLLVGTIIFASGSSLSILILGRLVSGIGAMTIAVLVLQMLAQWFSGREIGTAMGVIHTCMPIGSILSLNVLSVVSENLGWHASIWLTAGFLLVALIIFVCLYSPAPGKRQLNSTPYKNLIHDIRSIGIPIWLVGGSFMLFNASYITFITFTPDLLNTAGFSISSAGFLTSLIVWPALVISPLIGYVMDRVDHKRTIVVTGSLAMAILMLWTPHATGWILALILLIGIASNIVPPPILALPSETTSPERLGLGYGIFSTCLNVGLFIGPASAGFVKDITGSYQTSYALMSVYALVIIPVILLIRRRNPTPPSLL
ncbi:nitrate/nitrite transporter [Chloroflexota bacterium]